MYRRDYSLSVTINNFLSSHYMPGTIQETGKSSQQNKVPSFLEFIF